MEPSRFSNDQHCPAEKTLVKPTERLVLQDKEDGIDEFDVFDVVIDHVEGDHPL